MTESEGCSAGSNGSFQKEIASMMHGFGDAAVPSPATVALVESIVLKQLRQILIAAGKVADRNNQKSIAPVHIIFLMRRNKVKLQRLLKYMNSNQLFKMKRSIDDQYLPNILLEGERPYEEKNIYAEAIEMFDDTGSIADYLENDVVDRSRKVRLDSFSQNMSLEKYRAYHKARRATFGHSKAVKLDRFKQWIYPQNDTSLSAPTLNLLSYLAYETVAQIIDLCFLVRQDWRNVLNEPFARLEGGNYCNTLTFDAQNAKPGQGVSPITVAQVKEAMRRYMTPRIGLNGLFYRNIKAEMPMRFLAM